MIRIATLHAVTPRVRYHKRSPALSAQEKVGEWLGNGCPLAGLTTGAAVDERAFESFLLGRDLAGTYLGQNRKRMRRAGWDLVVSVHKSLSVAALCLDVPTGHAVRDAYNESVRTFADLIDTLACRQNAGLRPVDTGNAIVAAFTHERSRHNDPHLHTHFIVINATLDRNDPRGPTWRSLEPSPLFRQHKALDLAFNRELLRALRARGVAAEFDRNGRAVLPIIPGPICDRLSTANQSIRKAAEAPREPQMETLHEEHYRNLLNDRMRPPKMPPLEGFDVFLTSLELEAITQGISSAPRPLPPSSTATPAQIPKLIEQEYRRSNLFFTPKALFRATIDVARQHLAIPLQLILAARLMAPTVSRIPRPKTPLKRLPPLNNPRKAKKNQDYAQGRKAAGGTQSVDLWSIAAAHAKILKQRVGRLASLRKPLPKTKKVQNWSILAAKAKILRQRTTGRNIPPAG